MFINLFCALSYFAKILESMTDQGAGFAPFTTIQYLDYCFTWYVYVFCPRCSCKLLAPARDTRRLTLMRLHCSPLIVLDLLWNLEAPFRATMTVLVFTCLVIAVASAAAPPPANYAWFTMGMFVFAGTYYGIVMLIQERLAFYVDVARDGNAKQSIKFLKTGCYIFFAIWVLYPILWVLSDKAAGLISQDLDHVITAVLDVFAKSAYGFALLYFRIYFDKKLEQSGVDVEGECVLLTVACCLKTLNPKPRPKPAHLVFACGAWGVDPSRFVCCEEEALTFPLVQSSRSSRSRASTPLARNRRRTKTTWTAPAPTIIRIDATAITSIRTDATATTITGAADVIITSHSGVTLRLPAGCL